MQPHQPYMSDIYAQPSPRLRLRWRRCAGSCERRPRRMSFRAGLLVTKVPLPGQFQARTPASGTTLRISTTTKRPLGGLPHLPHLSLPGTAPELPPLSTLLMMMTMNLSGVLTLLMPVTVDALMHGMRRVHVPRTCVAMEASETRFFSVLHELKQSTVRRHRLLSRMFVLVTDVRLARPTPGRRLVC